MIKILIIWLGITQIMDVAFTKVLLSRGWEEVNVISLWLIEAGGYLLLLTVKLGLILFIWINAQHIKNRYVVYLMVFSIGSYTMLNVYQLGGILV